MRKQRRFGYARSYRSGGGAGDWVSLVRDATASGSGEPAEASAGLLAGSGFKVGDSGMIGVATLGITVSLTFWGGVKPGGGAMTVEMEAWFLDGEGLEGTLDSLMRPAAGWLWERQSRGHCWPQTYSKKRGTTEIWDRDDARVSSADFGGASGGKSSSTIGIS
ncbi:hypothetical protein CISG_05046 [Coccidioides immitis RMSCC 3703]|uniref:Uncharacterized protein n=1 Tax=Coccidioides immitis RMSCC 3703 TaxID=454286 RepID=A0A0J8QSD9_COCIT|nr:hypothetical protein CISG_05046 [Coccidioides immitis RMSCC 3703]